MTRHEPREVIDCRDGFVVIVYSGITRKSSKRYFRPLKRRRVLPRGRSVMGYLERSPVGPFIVRQVFFSRQIFDREPEVRYYAKRPQVDDEAWNRRRRQPWLSATPWRADQQSL